MHATTPQLGSDVLIRIEVCLVGHVPYNVFSSNVPIEQ